MGALLMTRSGLPTDLDGVYLPESCMCASLTSVMYDSDSGASEDA